MIDVAIIGAGICGCSLLYELSKYEINAVLFEKENDVSLGTTKANSAIVHAGYDPKPGTKMARYNVRGSQKMEALCRQLDVPYRKTGSLVLAFRDDQIPVLQELLEQGNQNGVRGMQLLSREQTLTMEPAINPAVVASLYAPDAAVISPWELAIALAETAVLNGAQVQLDTEVTAIRKEDGCFVLETSQGAETARFVVNAAGIHAGAVSEMAEKRWFTVFPRRGQYYLLDKNQGSLVRHILFPCPDTAGKGVLVAPTVHGNVIAGPNAEPAELDDVSTTAEGLSFVQKRALQSVPGLDFRQSIRNFSGLRAATDHDDFLVGPSAGQPGFFHMAGIKSPGLSAAPAIAEDMVQMLSKAGLPLHPKTSFSDTRRVFRFHLCSMEEQERAIRENPLYGSIVCRCESVTEGEIVDALHRPIAPRSVDGVKRRCNSGMGRCQGGFCGPKVQEIISREWKLPLEQIPLDRAGSWILLDETKTGGGKDENGSV